MTSAYKSLSKKHAAYTASLAQHRQLLSSTLEPQQLPPEPITWAAVRRVAEAEAGAGTAPVPATLVQAASPSPSASTTTPAWPRLPAAGGEDAFGEASSPAGDSAPGLAIKPTSAPAAACLPSLQPRPQLAAAQVRPAEAATATTAIPSSTPRSAAEPAAGLTGLWAGPGSDISEPGLSIMLAKMLGLELGTAVAESDEESDSDSDELGAKGGERWGEEVCGGGGRTVMWQCEMCRRGEAEMSHCDLLERRVGV